jgi:hypothetical protein
MHALLSKEDSAIIILLDPRYHPIAPAAVAKDIISLGVFNVSHLSSIKSEELPHNGSGLLLFFGVESSLEYSLRPTGIIVNAPIDVHSSTGALRILQRHSYDRQRLSVDITPIPGVCI